MNKPLIFIGVPVTAIFVASIISFARNKTKWEFLHLLGSSCLVLVVLAHIAEANHIFPAMGWGLPDSPGHYLDLGSAILGLILLPVGYAFGRDRTPK